MRNLIVIFLLFGFSFSAWGQNTGEPEEDAFQGVYDQHAIQAGRASLVGGLGNEVVDTLSGRLLLTYTDAVIPGEGGFDLSVLRRYVSLQNRAAQIGRK